jgi:hypothetical protein
VGVVRVQALAATWSLPPAEAPATPLVIGQSVTYASLDVQAHNRGDSPVHGKSPWDAQHGSACQGPPATHTVQALSDSVFICNGHVMTSAYGNGYGEIVLTPNQLVNCSAGCTVQFDLSTERMSQRDWPDVWLTPWNDNLVLPFDAGDVDLQGVPRQGIHINGGGGTWQAETIANYVETALPNTWWIQAGDGIDTGVNQAAVRQTYKLTVQPGQVKFERLASATAPAQTWTVDSAGNPEFSSCACLLASDYVVQFGHHSYNPTKDGAGVPATWHWFGNPSGLILSNATPFTLIHASPTLVRTNNSLITFDAPAPANAFLRFSGVCKIKVDGNDAPKMTFIGHYEHASDYFVPIQAGTQSITVSFADDDWYKTGFGCSAQDFHVWAKNGGPPPSPTPTPLPFTPTATPTALPTATLVPTNTAIVPTPTRTPLPPTPTRTATPSGPKQACTLRWGNGTLESYGQLTQAECAARGN